VIAGVRPIVRLAHSCPAADGASNRGPQNRGPQSSEALAAIAARGGPV